MITTFNTAVTETASEILGKHRQKKEKNRVTAEFLDLCDKRRELRNKIFEPEISEKWKESEIEENLRKTNSKRAYLLVKDLTTCELLLSKIVQENASHKNERYWPDRRNTAVQYWTVPRDTENDHPILCKEVEAAVHSLKKWKSAWVDNILAELVQAGGTDVITALTTICNKVWQTGEWRTPWTRCLIITLSKKGNLQQCQNYRTISLISHPSKVMLKIVLNRLKLQAEKIIAE